MNLSTDKFVKFIEFINFNDRYIGQYNTMNIVSDNVFDSKMFYLYDTNGDSVLVIFLNLRFIYLNQRFVIHMKFTFIIDRITKTL